MIARKSNKSKASRRGLILKNVCHTAIQTEFINDVFEMQETFTEGGHYNGTPKAKANISSYFMCLPQFPHHRVIYVDRIRTEI